jgi:flagellin
MGDSSAGGSSVNSLHFATVSAAKVGDANGTMAYSQGQGVFMDATKSGAVTDTANDLLGAAQTITFTVWDSLAGATATKTLTTTATDTLNTLVDKINKGGYGVTASVQTSAQATGDATATKGDLGIEIRGNVSSSVAPTAGSSAGYTQITGTVKDGADAAAAGAAAADSGTGSAQISYMASATGASNLTQFDLSSQSNAQSTLIVLNQAISNVAAQDGYIGAQINTLNAASSVISTQQQNIVAAQNAVQATDYAQASSNLSKFEILSQTGISALAQANSLQQEVLKLLQ